MAQTYDSKSEIYQEVELLTICIDVTLLALILFMICYIVARYLCRLQIKSRLIVMFYIFAFLTTGFRLAQTVSMLITVNKKILNQNVKTDVETSDKIETMNESLANIFMTCVGLVIVSNMYKIAISI